MRRATILALLLAGCATNPPYRSEKLSDAYKQIPMQMTTNTGAYRYWVFVRPYEDSGKLALCGLYAEEAGVNAGDLVYAMMADHRAELRLGDQRVSDFTFMPGYRGIYTVHDKTAQCIRTETDWRTEFADAKPSLHASFPIRTQR